MNLNKNHSGVHEDLMDAVSLRLNAETKELLSLCQAFYQYDSLVSVLREAAIHYSLKLKRDLKGSIKKLDNHIVLLNTKRDTPFGEVQDRYKALEQQRLIYQALLNRVEYLLVTFKHSPTKSNLGEIVRRLKSSNSIEMIDN